MTQVAELPYLVSIGPRNRRRLTLGAVVIAVVAAIVAGDLATRPSHHAGFSIAPSPTASGHLVFGMTPQQVRRLTGDPTSVAGRCWLFRTKGKMVGSVTVAPFTANAVKLCFFDGGLAEKFLHKYVPKKHAFVWLTWPAFISAEPVSKAQS